MARSTLDRIGFSKMTAAAKANSRRRTASGKSSGDTEYWYFQACTAA